MTKIRSRRAVRNERTYRRWLATLPPPSGATAPDLRLVYTDKEENNYYLFGDPLAMTVERSEKIAEAVVASSYNVKKDDIVEALAEAMSDIKKGKNGAAIGKLADLRHRMDRIGVEALVLDIAVLYFVTDNENPFSINPLTLAEKRRRAEADDDLRAFFLRVIWETYGERREISGGDFLRYLRTEEIKKSLRP